MLIKVFWPPVQSRQKLLRQFQFFSYSEAAIVVLSLSQMQQEWTEVEAIFWNEMCQKWYGIFWVFDLVSKTLKGLKIK
jgi:hypothetical protein